MKILRAALLSRSSGQHTPRQVLQLKVHWFLFLHELMTGTDGPIVIRKTLLRSQLAASSQGTTEKWTSNAFKASLWDGKSLTSLGRITHRTLLTLCPTFNLNPDPG
jgi:hypothetical protein